MLGWAIALLLWRARGARAASEIHILDLDREVTVGGETFYANTVECGTEATFKWTYDDESRLEAGDVLVMSFRKDFKLSNPLVVERAGTVAYPATQWTFTFPKPLSGAWLEGETADNKVQVDGGSVSLMLWIEDEKGADINSATSVRDFEFTDSDFELRTGQCGADDVTTRNPNVGTAAQRTPSPTPEPLGCEGCECAPGNECAPGLTCKSGACELSVPGAGCSFGEEGCECARSATRVKGCLSPALRCCGNTCQRAACPAAASGAPTGTATVAAPALATASPDEPPANAAASHTTALVALALATTRTLVF